MAFKLPSITSAIPRDLRAFCDRVREALNAQGNDRIITRRDLIATGVVVVGPGNTLQPTDPTELAKVKYDTPPAPTGLATSGAIANIILTWDAPNYPGHSYTEVYVADTNTFTSRVKLADVPGSIYSHSVGASTTKYYWIRFVNVAEVPGPYNSTTGVSGTTGDDPDYLISVLSDAYGVTGDGLFFQLNSPTVINGVTIPAGTYIKQAVIADATIARAKIQDLAVDNAKIADLSAVKITAGSLQVGSYIQSSNFITSVQGWKIDAAGSVEFGSGTFRGALSGATGTFSGTVSASTFNTATSGQRVELSSSTNDVRVYNSSGTLIAQLGGTGLGASLKATSTTLVGPAVWGVNTGAPGVYGQATTGEAVYGAASSSGYGVFGTSSSSNGGRFTSTTGISLVVPSNGADIIGLVSLFRNANDVTQNCTNSNSGASAHAIRAGNTNKGSSGLVGPARNDCDFFAEGIGVYLPFTGAHEGVILKTESFELGDILVDGNILFRKGLSDCASEMFVSTTANQKAVIGVLEKTQEITESIYLAAAIIEMEIITTPQERKEFEPEFEPIVTSKPVINPAFYELAPTHHLCTVNAVGEGLINVCGEGGDIEAGDLIVTSSLPGKGMKQSDDIVRAVTVAKARESVTFASPTEVKQIACIYLCG